MWLEELIEVSWREEWIVNFWGYSYEWKVGLYY